MAVQSTFNLISDPGVYIQLSQPETLGLQKFTLTLPYSDELQVSNHQNIIRPVEKFLTDLKDFIVSSADTGSSLPAAGIDLTNKIADLFGIKLGNRWYYASSWGGQEPASFSLNLKFNRGMSGQWDAREEVYHPILYTYARTVAQDQRNDGSKNFGNLITSPMPSSFGVFTTYAAQIATNTAIGGVQILSGLLGQQVAQDAIKSISKADDSISNELMKRIWTVDFGYCSGKGTEFSSFFKIDKCIINDSTFKFGSGVQKSNIGAQPYPISGELNLSFITETIMTNGTILNGNGVGV
jgi:hypothetical protein